jgi:hypothetical protein
VREQLRWSRPELPKPQTRRRTFAFASLSHPAALKSTGEQQMLLPK